ncbi:MAG: zinc ribbon domain-containing protein [Oscillospiraceae bacterium]|nr:zinc ribbon domain-containing protein [Oscillospiraceae bacterium]
MADIFDKMVGGLGKGVAVVSANSKAMVEKARVNAAINNIDEERKQLAELLGMKVYETHMSGNDVTVNDFIGFIVEIKNRLQLIDEQHDQLGRIESELSMVTGVSKAGSSTCKCGAINPTGSRFCAKCGDPM